MVKVPLSQIRAGTKLHHNIPCPKTGRSAVHCVDYPRSMFTALPYLMSAEPDNGMRTLSAVAA